jgi:cysteinyl-tRNA synthetase
MAIRLFNTYSRSVEEFHPLDPAGREVKMYTCGPTVYSHAHIGNFRAYIFEDLLQRHLEQRGFLVRRVMNLTDVDDKTIRGSREAGVPLAEFTAPFKKAFFEDLDTLRIKRADSFPEATDPRELAKMIEMIGTLMERGLAYQAEDKSVYFRINKFPDYGKLAHFDLAELRSTGRVKSDEYDKEHVGDFALWKAWDEADGAVKWESPWGAGRPGWHIECSAMATQLLGEQLDIHCGGVDNIFPHHEAEIAQTEGCTGKKFVRYWLHCAHLMVEGQKMAKSLGNFYTLRDVIAKGYSGREARYALMRVHYRAPLNFTWEGMEEAREALRRIDDWVRRFNAEMENKPNPEAPSSKLQVRLRTDSLRRAPEKHQAPTPGTGFQDALDDDLNISGALGVLFETIRETNRRLDLGEMDASEAQSWLEWWGRVDQVLGVGGEEAAAPAEIAELAEARVQARLAKDWRKSDELRDELAARGWEARDTKDGQKITRRGGS